MDYKSLDKQFFKQKNTSGLEPILVFLSNFNIHLQPPSFINFEAYNKIPGFRTKVLNSNDIAKYNSHSNRVEIFEECINHKFINNKNNFHEKSFHRALFNSIQDTDFLKLTFVHEVGHYIQHEDFKSNKQLLNNPQKHHIHDFIQKTLFYNTAEEICKLSLATEELHEAKERKDTNEHLHKIVTEGFADSFSYIIFYQTANDKQNAFKVLSSHLNSRETARTECIEYYFTDKLLVNVLEDLKNGKYFTSLSDIKDYINQQIENYVPKFIEERLKKDDEVSVLMNKRYLGYISKRLQIDTIEKLYEKLEEIGISKDSLYKNSKPLFNFNDDDFQYGIKIAKEFITEVKVPHFSQSLISSKVKSINNISNLRDTFLNSDITTIKNKI